MKVVLTSLYQGYWSFTDNVKSIKSATTHCKYLALWMTVEWKLTVKLEDPAWAARDPSGNTFSYSRIKDK